MTDNAQNGNNSDDKLKPALQAIQSVASVVLHNVNNLLAPMLLSISKIEMYLAANKIEELKRDFPGIVENCENHVSAITETLKILHEAINSDPDKIAEFKNVNIKQEIKKRVEGILGKK